MYKTLAQYITENDLHPFSATTPFRHPIKKRFKTKEAKHIVQHIFSTITSSFTFSDTSHLLLLFDRTDSSPITEEQTTFIQKIQRESFPVDCSRYTKGKKSFTPPYSYLAVTADEETYSELKENKVPVQLLMNEWDLRSAQDYDVIEAIHCDVFERALDQIPQVIFCDSIQEVYTERYLEELSQYQAIITDLYQHLSLLPDELFPAESYSCITTLYRLLSFLEVDEAISLSLDDYYARVDTINKELEEKIQNLTLDGQSIFEVLSSGRLPTEVEDTIHALLKKHDVPESLVDIKVPLEFDREAFKEYQRGHERKKYNQFKEKLQDAHEITQIPTLLAQLDTFLLILDFVTGLGDILSSDAQFITQSDELKIENAKNMFLSKPQPVSFSLGNDYTCSVLTGANSGGKTTLLEHLLQVIVFGYLGLPIQGNGSVPVFDQIYYFSKQKGSTNKGAFETLLTQFASITPTSKTLILADEIESVTEPGIAARIIYAIVSYFETQQAYVVVATHLGQELKDDLPNHVRIDGIQAQGLDENNELIVDHNPVLGKLARSTPELIIRRLANKRDEPFISYLADSLKEER